MWGINAGHDGFNGAKEVEKCQNKQKNQKDQNLKEQYLKEQYLKDYNLQDHLPQRKFSG
jgi:hypothetical protein